MEFRDDSNMDRNNDEEVVITLVGMFGNLVNHDVITAVVENCGGDLNQSVEAVMNIASEASTSEEPDAIANGSDATVNESNATANGSNATANGSNATANGSNSTAIGSNATANGSNATANGSNATANEFNNWPKHDSNSPNQKKKRGDKSKNRNGQTGNNAGKQKNFAAALQVSMPKETENKPVVKPTEDLTNTVWTEQFREILTNYNHGSRIMVIMRGASGSGKSFLAKKIVDFTIGPNVINYGTHIFSSDDYFLNKRGLYIYDKSKLSDAHRWNQERVRMSAHDGLSPIIVDNTNIVIWEMEPYIRDAVRNGYIIELMEPNTPWARKSFHLYHRSSHNVPMPNIKRMLEQYQDGLTAESVMKTYKLSYPPQMVPPVLRNIPVIVSKSVTSTSSTPAPLVTPGVSSTPKSPLTIDDTENHTPNSSDVNGEIPNITNMNLAHAPQNCNGKAATVSKSDHDATLSIKLNENTGNGTENRANGEHQISNHFADFLKLYQKFDIEWENGEHWDSKATAKLEEENTNNVTFQPKPQRKRNADASETSNLAETDEVQKTEQNLLESINNCQEWSDISMFMPPWNDNTPSTSAKAPTVPVETMSSSTCMEIGDTDSSNSSTHKIITATSRDINMFFEPNVKEKIPDKLMLDKSTTTNEQLMSESYRCKNEEKHFIAFRKLFKNIERASLRDIFDQCCGDVNWAVDIVFDGMANKQLPTVDTNELSDEEEEISEPCACLAAYNIIPDTSAETGTNNEPIVTETPEAQADVYQSQKKVKKESVLSPASIQLKRQIEKNVVISQEHYSDHCLKIRKIRRGEYNKDNEIAGPSNAPDSSSNATEGDCDEFLNDEDEINDFDGENPPSDETFISMNLGTEFIKQLDNLFGRNDMEYPDCILPKISIPMSMLNEINALWMESVMNQLEEQSKQSELMIKQDEEFARQLAAKEEEMARAGIEQPVPDFKEILDMDVALAIYQKDVNGWRKHEPKDLAAKLSRDKLYFLFPEVPQDTLAEMLLAHDYNFQNTVEVLLVSTGKEDILAMKNGVNKFVMEKETARKEKILREERQALLEAEWPFLPNKNDRVDMDTVNNYRNQAQKHLMYRHLHFNKAREFISRGMTQVASYYSELAFFHKQRFDYANHLAVASLMQVHAANSKDTETIDLHLMRVSEAIQSTDMFIDAHIELLKKSRERGGPHTTNLFIITGRGLHSVGGPKVKPAVGRRLQARRLRYHERNPGLLIAKISADDKLTYQMS